ncbi:MAG: hypothetical protein ILP24_00490 [Paludibacteraceae bacterium]|nr:hypothetical protein [Paludibacteraceae bacterium]
MGNDMMVTPNFILLRKKPKRKQNTQQQIYIIEKIDSKRFGSDNNTIPEEKVYTTRGDYAILFDLNDNSPNALFIPALKDTPEYF